MIEQTYFTLFIQLLNDCLIFLDFDGKKYLNVSLQLVFTNIEHQNPKADYVKQQKTHLLTTIAPPNEKEERKEIPKCILSLVENTFKEQFFANAVVKAYHGKSAINATGVPRLFPNDFGYGICPLLANISFSICFLGKQ